MSEIRLQGRELLDAARRERTPAPADRERIFGALMATAALSSAAGAAATPSLLAKWAGGVGKWLLLAGLTTSVAGGVYGVMPHHGARAPVAHVVRPLPSAVGVVAPGAFVPQLGPTPSLGLTSSAPTQQLVPPRSSAPRKENLAPSLEQELSNLHAAHAAYRGGDAARALSLIAEDKARFPKSQLAVERSTLEALALCRVGRTGEARRLADQLRRQTRAAAALSGLDGSCAAR